MSEIGAPFNPDSYLRDLKIELTNAKPKFQSKEDAIPTILDFSHCSGAADASSSTFTSTTSKLKKSK